MNKLILNIFLFVWWILLWIFINNIFLSDKSIINKSSELSVLDNSIKYSSLLLRDLEFNNWDINKYYELKDRISNLSFNSFDSNFKKDTLDLLIGNELNMYLNWEINNKNIGLIDNDEFITILPKILKLFISDFLIENNSNKENCINYLSKNFDDIFDYKSDYYFSFDSINESNILNNNWVFNDSFYETYLIFTNYFNKNKFLWNINCDNYHTDYYKNSCNSFISYIAKNLWSITVLDSDRYSSNIYYINYLNWNIDKVSLINQLCSYE